MAVPRVVAIVALFFFAAGSAEMASKPLVGISREQSEPEMKVAGSVYYFEDENHVPQENQVERRQIKSMCSKEDACSATRVDDCCKLCTFGSDKVLLDWNTFKQTLPRGTRKEPMMLKDYCGLVDGYSWPHEKEDVVGTLRFPFEENKTSGLPFYTPDEKEYPGRKLVTYSQGGGVLFRKHSYKLMTPEMAISLGNIAKVFDSYYKGTAGFKLMVYKGYEPHTSGSGQPDPEDLFLEGRQLDLMLVFTKSRGGPCSSCIQNAAATSSSPFNEYAVKEGSTSAPPSCLTSLDKNSILYCKLKNIISVSQLNYRMLAEFGYEFSDYVKHQLYGDDTIGYMQAVRVAVRDGHRQCGPRADVAFLLDGSRSVGDDGWKSQVDFVRNFVNSVEVGQKAVRISVAVFAGPRFSHFADHYDHVNAVDTTETCSTENDCDHEVQESEGKFGTREVCNTDTGRCNKLVPNHCPVGTLYLEGNSDTPSLGCVCAPGVECLEPSGEGCTDAFFQFNAGDCGVSGSDLTDVVNIDPSTMNLTKYPNCQERSFFSHECVNCKCDGAYDYEWEEEHSTWTVIDFKDCTSSEQCLTLLDSKTPMEDGVISKCPTIGDGSIHNNQKYRQWRRRDPLCFPDGASHLSLGLKHVLVGTGHLDSGDRVQGMFHPTNGASPVADKVPKRLIVMSDGKSNAHFEPYQWSDQIHDAGIQVYAVGLGTRKVGGAITRSDYLKELNDMASEPLDRFRFDVTKDDGLTSEILRHISDSFCEIPIVIPPGGFEITPEVDEGDAQTFQVVCDNMTSTVFVVVDTIVGSTKVFVSGGKGAVRNPSEYNSGPGGVGDTSDDMHKVLKLSKPGEKLHQVFISVVNGGSEDAQFNVALYLDMFLENDVNYVGPNLLKLTNADRVVFEPKLQPSFGTISKYSWKILPTGANVDGDFEFVNGKIAITGSAAAKIASKTFSVPFGKRIELVTDETDPDCANGMFVLNIVSAEGTFGAEWSPTSISSVLSEGGDVVKTNGGRERRLAASAGLTIASAVSVECVDPAQCDGTEEFVCYKNSDNNDIFTVFENCSAIVAKPELLDYERQTEYTFEICALIASKSLSSDPCLPVSITITDSFERPTLEDVESKDITDLSGDILVEIPILNPGKISQRRLGCKRPTGVKKSNFYTISSGFDSSTCTGDSHEGCKCLIKTGKKPIEMDINVSVGLFYNGVQQDETTVLLEYNPTIVINPCLLPGGSCQNGGECVATGETAKECRCPAPFHGIACELQSDPCENVDCGNAEASVKAYLKSSCTNNGIWDKCECKCKHTGDGVCWYGDQCSSKLSQSCSEKGGFDETKPFSCKEPPSGRGGANINNVCVYDCDPGCDSTCVILGAAPEVTTTGAEVTTTPAPESSTAAPSTTTEEETPEDLNIGGEVKNNANTGEAGDTNKTGLVVGLVFLFLFLFVILFVGLYIWKKRQEREVPKTLPSTPATYVASPGFNAADPVSNPMYGVGLGGTDTYASGPGAGYRDVAPNQEDPNGGYLDVNPEQQISVADNPMYFMGANNDSTYAEASQGGYRDVAPNRPPQSGYRDVVPNPPPKSGYRDVVPDPIPRGGYRDVSPNPQVDGVTNPMYDSSSATATSVYDQARPGPSEPNYDVASSRIKGRASKGKPTYDIATGC
eukprot:m.10385 g.10385  ORF g.10385 m.10385 type:complete len:1650 (+) comp4252_c0_seq1:100-5049(+)